MKLLEKRMFCWAAVMLFLAAINVVPVCKTFAAINTDNLRPNLSAVTGEEDELEKDITGDGGVDDPAAELNLPADQTYSTFSKGTIDGGAADIAVIPSITSYTKEALAGKRVLIRVDYNVSDNAGNIKSDKRIRMDSLVKTLDYLMKNGATVVLISHNGKPKGKVVSALSLGPVANKLDEILNKEKGLGIKVVFHPESISLEGVKPGLHDEIVSGAINVLENTRFTPGDEANDIEMGKALAELVDNYMFIHDGFAVEERVHASTAGMAPYVQKIGIGFLVQEEHEKLEAARRKLFALLFGGGPKVKEKMQIVKNSIGNMPKGGFIFLASGSVPAFLKVNYGVQLGTSVGDEDIVNATEMMSLAKKQDVDVIIPLDFVAADKDLSKPVEGKKNWIDLKQLPDDIRIFPVTLDELISGQVKDATGQSVPLANVFLYDIGPKTVALFDQKAAAIPVGRSLVYNGTVGVDELSPFKAGADGVAEIIAVAEDRGVENNIVGGDTVKSAEKKKIKRGDKTVTLDKIVTHASSGGGAGLAVMRGTETKVIKYLADLQRQRNKVAEDGGVLGNQITILANDTDLVSEKARTGHKSIWTAINARAQGFLLNHSEYRGDLEQNLGTMVKLITPDIQSGNVSKDSIQDEWLKAVKATGASDAQAKQTLDILSAYMAKYVSEHSIENSRHSFDPALEMERTTRSLVNRIINIQLKAIVALNEETHKVKKVEICVGDTKAQNDAKRTAAVIEQDVREITEGVADAQLKGLGSRFAMEPRFLIGQTEPVIDYAAMNRSHELIKKVMSSGKDRGQFTTKVSYGGGSGPKNAEMLLRLPDVDGLLIGGAALNPKEIGEIIVIAARVSRETGKAINIGLNWKSADQTNGFKARIKEFAAMFAAAIKSGDLGGKVSVTISTNQTDTVSRQLQAVLDGGLLDGVNIDALAQRLSVSKDVAEARYLDLRAADTKAFKAAGGDTFKQFLSGTARKIATYSLDPSARVFGGETILVDAALLAPQGKDAKPVGGFYALVDAMANNGLKGKIKIVVYGQEAENIVALVPDAKAKNVESVASMEEFLNNPNNKGILETTMVLVVPENVNAPEMALAAQLKVRRMVASPVITLSFAKAIRELFGEVQGIGEAQWIFVNNLARQFGVIPVAALKDEKTRNALDGKVKRDEVFAGLTAMELGTSSAMADAVGTVSTTLQEVGIGA